MSRGGIEVRGPDFPAALRKAAQALPQQARLAMDGTATLVLNYARAHVPRSSGAAAASLHLAGGPQRAAVVGGGPRAPYLGWLDYGGAVGRKQAVHRPYRRQGRYLYPGLLAHGQEAFADAERAARTALESSGLDVT